MRVSELTHDSLPIQQ